MSSTLVDLLRSTNRMIRYFLREAQPASENQPDLSMVYPQINSLWLRLDEVGNKLRNEPLPPPSDAESRAELSHYAENLKHLRQALEGIQPQLLARRAQLDAERSRLQGISGWVTASKFTDPTALRNPVFQITLKD